MNSWKHATKLAGLSLVAALSMLAFTAAGAQASGAFWTAASAGSAHTNLGAGQERTITGLSANPGVLLVPGLGLEVTCAEAHASGKILSAGAAEALVLFLGCKVVGDEFGDCTILPTLSSSSTNQIHATGNGLLLLHDSKHYLLATGLGGEKEFARIVIEGDFCVFNGEDAVVKGSVLFKLPDALALQENHTLEPMLEGGTEFNLVETLTSGIGLSYGIQPAEIHGSAVSVSIGAGLLWGAK